MRPCDYTDAGTLVSDFWNQVEAVAGATSRCARPRQAGRSAPFGAAVRVRAQERSLAMKTLKVGIASCEAMKARTMAIARGELQPKPSDSKAWFTAPESFARLPSKKNRALLAMIAKSHPESLHGLAARSGRTPGNLSRTLRTMARYGRVHLHRGTLRSRTSGRASHRRSKRCRYRWP